MMTNKSVEVFFLLVKAGLFGLTETTDSTEKNLWEGVDWSEVYQLAEEQSMIGLVAAGLDRFKVNDSRFTVPQMVALQFIGQTLQIEQRNKAMNGFINELLGKLRKAGIYALIVKGQGVAQCYEKPFWRACGDIDFYLNQDDFQKAKIFFRPLVDKFDPDDDFTRHINMHYGEWVVEIHANQNCSLSPRINRVMREVHKDVFYNGSVRSWNNNGVLVFLPSANNDVIIIFTHFLNHFYRGGVGIRQICDWCRLLYTYKDSLDYGLMENRLKRAGLLKEWRAFGSFAIEYLGMPVEAMPLLKFRDESLEFRDRLKDKEYRKYKRNADKICEFILEVGNFGHNRDTSYYGKYPFVIRKSISFWRRLKDLYRHARIFPMDSLRFLYGVCISGLNSMFHGV